MFLQKKIGFIFMFFFFLMPLQIICAKDLAWLTDAAARVQEWKTTSENKAKELKTHLSRDKLIEAMDKYMVAKAAVDGWLKGLRMQVVTLPSIENGLIMLPEKLTNLICTPISLGLAPAGVCWT